MPPDQAYDNFEGLEDIQRVLARRVVDSGAVSDSVLEKYDVFFNSTVALPCFNVADTDSNLAIPICFGVIDSLFIGVSAVYTLVLISILLFHKTQ